MPRNYYIEYTYIDILNTPILNTLILNTPLRVYVYVYYKKTCNANTNITKHNASITYTPFEV